MTAKLTEQDIERAKELVRICEEQKRKFYAYAPDSEVLELFPLLVDEVVRLRVTVRENEATFRAAWDAMRAEAAEAWRSAKLASDRCGQYPVEVMKRRFAARNVAAYCRALRKKRTR